MATRRVEQLLSHLTAPGEAPHDADVSAHAAGAGVGGGARDGVDTHGVSSTPTAWFSSGLKDLPPLDDEYDFIVVGAGSSGCPLARRLADAGHSVLLLEAGVDDNRMTVTAPPGVLYLQRSELDWCFETPPQDGLRGRVMFLPRGRLLGGCSSINAMLWVRCDPANYNGWAASGAEGWDYTSVLPYFKRMEAYTATVPASATSAAARGADGPIPVKVPSDADLSPLTPAFVAACEEHGLPALDDYNAAPSIVGAGVGQQNVTDGIRRSTSMYLPPPSRGVASLSDDNFRVRADGKLTVACLTRVTRVAMEDGRAVGVYYRRGSHLPEALAGVKDRLVRCRREVVLSGGAYCSPWLLMLSGIGPRSVLNKAGIPVVADVPAVGRNLSDHLFVGQMRTATSASGSIPVQMGLHALRLAAQYALTHSGKLSVSPLQATAFYHSQQAAHDLDHAPSAPDSQLHFVPCLPHRRMSEAANLEGVGSHIDAAKEAPYGVALCPTLLRPLSRGYVEVASADPLVHPVVEHNYLQHPRDVAVLVEGLRMSRRVLDSKAFKPFALGPEIVDTTIPHPPDSDEYLEEYARKSAVTVYHPVGTCRMGRPGDATTVVDPRCRVVGIRGLRVVDASIIPFVPSGNTNAPAIMVGERAADLILDDYA